MTTPSSRILCVEDNQDIRDYLRVLLTTAGYEVVSAETLMEGLRKAKSLRFDLYLLDNYLPDGTGIELCKLIRTFDSGTPILFYSAITDDETKKAALAAGAQSYLSKVEPSDILEQTITKLMESKENAPGAVIGGGTVSGDAILQQEFDRLAQRYNSDFRFLLMRASTGQYDCILTSFLVLKDLYAAIMKLHEIGKLELRIIPYPISLRANETLLREFGFDENEIEMINNFLKSTRETQGREFEDILEEGLPILCRPNSLRLSV